MYSRPEELKQLIHQNILENFDLKYVGKFQAFQTKFPDNKHIQIDCSSQIGFIYSFHELYEDAWKQLAPLIEERNKIEDFPFSVILQYALECLSHLKQFEEAKTLFERFIDDKCNDDFYQMEGLLHWYVKALNPKEFELSKYEGKINKVMEELGYISKKTTLKEKVLEIKSVHSKANQEFGSICVEAEKRSPEETIDQLEVFINSSPPNYYIQMANDFKLKLQAK